MPRIQGYEQQYVASGQIPTRQANAEDFGGPGLQQLGHGIQATGQDVGYAQRQLFLAAQDRAVSDAHVALSDLNKRHTERAAAFEQSLQAHDTEAVDRFLQGTEEDRTGSLKADGDALVEKYAEYPAAVRVIREGVARASEHFATHFVNVQIGLAKAHAIQSALQHVDNWKNSVYTNPAQLSRAQAEHDNYVSALPVDEAKKQELRRFGNQEFIESMFRGMIDGGNASNALMRLERGDFPSMKGDARPALVHAAKTAIHAEAVRDAQAQAELVKQQKNLANASQLVFVQQLAAHDADPLKNKMPDPVAVSRSEFAKYDPDGAQAFIGILHTRAHEALSTPQRTNPVEMRKLFNRIHLPESDPRKIIDPTPIHQAYSAQKLSWDDMKHLEKELFDSLSPDGSKFGQEKKRFFDAIEKKVVQYDAFQVLTDPTAPERFLWFQQDVENRIAQYRKEGKDPRVLFDRNSKDYMGTDATLEQYRKNPFDVYRERQDVPQLQQAPPAPTGKRRSLDEIVKGQKP